MMSNTMETQRVGRQDQCRTSQDHSRAPLVFSAFLSHRYRSPAINRFFFELFAEEAQVQFSIDRGDFATNVTRLERLMRDSDAFVGLYPFHGDGLERPRRSDLEKESRYFRLELDIAERSRKPSIVFVDSRYGEVIDPPSSFIQCRFDWQQVSGEAPVPRVPLFRERFRAFCVQVRTSLANLAVGNRNEQGRTNVGILLPGPCAGAGGLYGEPDRPGEQRCRRDWRQTPRNALAATP
jgi:hypothetical protein